MGDLEKLLEIGATIGSDTIPAGSGGGEGAKIVLAIFEANPGKYFTGRALKKLFEEEEIGIKSVSNILHSLYKQGKLERPQTGTYRLIQ